MGISLAVNIGKIMSRKRRLGADNYIAKNMYAWTPIEESRLILTDRRIV